MDGKLVPVLGIDQLGIAVQQRADPRQIAGPAGAKERPSLMPVHGFDPVLVVLGLHAFGLKQMRDPLREALIGRRSLSLQFPFSHFQHPSCRSGLLTCIAGLVNLLGKISAINKTHRRICAASTAACFALGLNRYLDTLGISREVPLWLF